MPVTFVCGYCGAELAVVDDVVSKKELKQFLADVPETCPKCGAALRGQIQYDKITIEGGRVKGSYKGKSRKKEIESVI
jgi:predicted nucleic acid-binding Zn ribbon protein